MYVCIVEIGQCGVEQLPLCYQNKCCRHCRKHCNGAKGCGLVWSAVRLSHVVHLRVANASRNLHVVGHVDGVCASEFERARQRANYSTILCRLRQISRKPDSTRSKGRAMIAKSREDEKLRVTRIADIVSTSSSRVHRFYTHKVISERSRWKQDKERDR